MDNTSTELGILVLGFNRPLHLQAVLESLRLQGRLSNVNVWIDGTQGRGEYGDANKKTIEIAKRFSVKNVFTPWGHFGIEKLMIDSVEYMAELYDRILVLEDDCFPLERFPSDLNHLGFTRRAISDSPLWLAKEAGLSWGSHFRLI